MDYVVDRLTRFERHLIEQVREAEAFTHTALEKYGMDWPKHIPMHPDANRPWINAFTRYFFGGFGFQRHQVEAHYCPVPDIQIMGGVGSGKTTPMAVSVASRASLNPSHDVLWVAPILPQARLAYEMILR